MITNPQRFDIILAYLQSIKTAQKATKRVFQKVQLDMTS